VILDRRAFIRENTRLLVPPMAPDLRLYLADEAVELWQKTEDDLGAIGLPPPFWAFAWAGGQALAKFIADRPETVAGKYVLDFASGSGVVAIERIRAGMSCWPATSPTAKTWRRRRRLGSHRSPNAAPRFGSAIPAGATSRGIGWNAWPNIACP
jgi:predicted nicotinamide N-methyase